MTIRFMRIGHLEKDEDWLGNNAAFTCPKGGCGKVYILSGHCHAALGLRSDPWPNNRADEENQLQRVSFPA
jgi:hypothetical protein